LEDSSDAVPQVRRSLGGGRRQRPGRRSSTTLWREDLCIREIRVFPSIGPPGGLALPSECRPPALSSNPCPSALSGCLFCTSHSFPPPAHAAATKDARYCAGGYGAHAKACTPTSPIARVVLRDEASPIRRAQALRLRLRPGSTLDCLNHTITLSLGWHSATKRRPFGELRACGSGCLPAARSTDPITR
jgi:hypothetical protein